MKQWIQTITGGITAGILLLTGVPVWAATEEDSSSSQSQSTEEGDTFDDGILTYTILDNMEVSITSCVTTATNVSIMPKIDGYTIVSIGEQAFAGCDSLQSVTIPSNITELGDGAFQACTALQSITLPDSLTAIPDGAFLNCSALTSITFGDHLTSIGRMAFAYCTSLTEIAVPDTVTDLGAQAFMGCSALTTVTLPEDMESLPAYLFQNCSALTEFTIPDTMTDIGYCTFVGCSSLKTLNLSEEHPTYQLIDDVLYSKDGTILYLYPAGIKNTAFAVPDTVTTIYDGAFFAAPLQSITLPDGLTGIGSGAFDYCTSLTGITIPESVTIVADHAFSDCSSLNSVVFAGDDEATEPELEIGDYAFFCCEMLMDVTLPKRVSEIGDYAFGVTEQEKVNADGSTSDEMENIAVSGFLLTGHEGVASKYISSSRSDGIRINFKSLEIPWVKIVSLALGCTAALVLIVVAIRIIKKKRLTATERQALEEAEAKRKIPLSQREPKEEPEEEPYQSILDEVPQRTHQFGHGTDGAPEDSSKKEI